MAELILVLPHGDPFRLTGRTQIRVVGWVEKTTDAEPEVKGAATMQFDRDNNLYMLNDGAVVHHRGLREVGIVLWRDGLQLEAWARLRRVLHGWDRTALEVERSVLLSEKDLKHAAQAAYDGDLDEEPDLDDLQAAAELAVRLGIGTKILIREDK